MTERFIDQMMDARNCRNLWVAVIETALADTFSYYKGRRELSLVWWDTEDCKIVCSFADIDHQSIRDKVYRDAKVK